MAVTQPSKRRKLNSPSSGDQISAKSISKPSTGDFYRQVVQWNLEQDYEQRPRKAKKKDKESTRLPIKTTEGKIERVPEVSVPEDEDRDSFLDTGSEEEEGSQAVAVVAVEKPKKALTKQQILEAQEDMARIALSINEDPEEHIASLKKLWELAENSPSSTVKRLALATQAAVYRDVIPGYRIRPLKAEDRTVKQSKDVRKLQNYEQTLLSNYQNYVKQLSSSAKRAVREGLVDDNGSSPTVAVSCASSLLKAAPHFNFRKDLIQLLVDQLSTRTVDDTFIASLSAIETLFSSDEDGGPSLEAVTLITRMMKAKDYRIDESLINSFLHLRLLSEFSSKASTTGVDKTDDTNTQSTTPPKYKKLKSKEKRPFVNKKQRKLAKDRKAVEKDMREANAVVSHEQRDKLQAETLKLVFATYFRILKLRIPNLMGAVLEGLATYAHLINQDFFGDILEALKDLIRQSVLAAENEAEGGTRRDHLRESLLCTITAFALLTGQDAADASSAKTASALNLDLSFFTTHVYSLLYPLSLNPNIELDHPPSSSRRLAADPDRHNNNNNNNDDDDDDDDDDDAESESEKTTTRTPRTKKINIQTPTLLLLLALRSILLPSSSHPPPPPSRLASFTKKLLTSSLQTPERSTLAIMQLLSNLVGVGVGVGPGASKTSNASSRAGKTLAPLWNSEERRGDRVYDGGVGLCYSSLSSLSSLSSGSVFASSSSSSSAGLESGGNGVFSSTVWEGELLRRHYVPAVREGYVTGVEAKFLA